MAFLRYQTVRNVGLGVLGLGAVVGLVVATSGGDDGPMPPASVVSHTATSPATAATPATAAPTAPSVALDDAAIALRADQAASPGEKIKDAFKGNPTKVNLYEETQDAVYDRLKIDANRDDVWDQEWSRDASRRWKRGDGKLLVAGQWVDEAPVAPEPTPTGEAPEPAADPYAAQLAKVAKVMLEERASSDKIKDYFRGNGPKINIYDDNKDGRWDRAKVDYDRDEVDDDKLTVKAGFLERKVEKTGVITVWDNGTWRAK